jgi:hypothetical protein
LNIDEEETINYPIVASPLYHLKKPKIESLLVEIKLCIVALYSTEKQSRREKMMLHYYSELENPPSPKTQPYPFRASAHGAAF